MSDILVATDGGEVLGDEREPIAVKNESEESLYGHSIRTVLLEDGSLASQCTSCGHVSNKITAFEQRNCQEGLGDA